MEILKIDASNLTQAKRKASLHFKGTYTIVQEFMYSNVKFSRINKKCASGAFEFSKWR